MKKGKVARVAGFVGALGVSTVLVTTAVQGTGAYFTDSESGSISANSGSLTLDITNGSTTMDFADLMPGKNVDNTVDYKVSVSSGTVDVWMVFDPNTHGYQAFTGGKNSPKVADGGLGRYGFFEVADSNALGTAFETGNLAYPDYNTSHNTWQSGMCPTDENGRGGSGVTSTGGSDTPPWCGVPAKILLASNLGTNATGRVTVTFGLNGPLQEQQNQVEFGGTVPFKLVATQHGQRP